METVISFIFFGAFVALIVGLIKPKSLEKIFKTSSRGKLAAINLGLMFGSAMVAGAVYPPTETTSSNFVETAQERETAEEAVDKTVEAAEGLTDAYEVADDTKESTETVTAEANPVVLTEAAAGTTASSIESEPEPDVVPIEEPEITEPENGDDVEEPEAETPASQPSSSGTKSVEEESSPQEESAPVPAASSCYCGSDSMNCSNFSSHAEAQDYYECCFSQVGYDVHGLDGDDDGSACENL